MIKAIMDIWGGVVLSFPEIRGRKDKTFIYKVNQKTRAIITTYKFRENWKKYLDVAIPESHLKDIFMLEDMLDIPVIIAVSFSDRKVFAKAISFYADRARIVHEGKAFLPKENFSLLIKSNN